MNLLMGTCFGLFVTLRYGIVGGLKDMTDENYNFESNDLENVMENIWWQQVVKKNSMKGHHNEHLHM